VSRPKIAEGRAPGRLGYYDLGATPYFASRADQRFSYCLHVPEDCDQDGNEELDLVVLVHGTARWAEHYRRSVASFAVAHRAVILAPLFPAGITADCELSSYKLVRNAGVDYDLILLDMVAEVAERYRLRSSRFLLHGFSGGGHFAHRFLFIHPERLLGLLDRRARHRYAARSTSRLLGRHSRLRSRIRKAARTRKGAGGSRAHGDRR
jgi:poly(3-hydroxybutyrate) depolymerase